LKKIENDMLSRRVWKMGVKGHLNSTNAYNLEKRASYTPHGYSAAMHMG
jgi:hypothetical protein